MPISATPSATSEPASKGAHLEGADLRDIQLDRIPGRRRRPIAGRRLPNGKGANLQGVHLDIFTDLSNAHLRDANLSGATFPRGDMDGADLENTNLSRAKGRGANLRDATLRFANLRGADLKDANLFDATLSGANLRGADLRGADLKLAQLGGADLTGAKINTKTDTRGANCAATTWVNGKKIFGRCPRRVS